jgi:hypothetical protein
MILDHTLQEFSAIQAKKEQNLTALIPPLSLRSEEEDFLNYS